VTLVTQGQSNKKKLFRIDHPYIPNSDSRKDKIITHLKKKLKSFQNRRISDRNNSRVDQPICMTQNKIMKHFSSDDETKDDFLQQQPFELHEDVIKQYTSNLPIISKSTSKVHGNDTYILNSTNALTQSISPIDPKYSSTSPISINNSREDRARSILKQLKMINKELDPKFKLSRIDMEELQSSKTLQLGEWNRDVDKSMVMNIMKEERRKEYWKRRIKATNP
jgi:hypothetical protein